MTFFARGRADPHQWRPDVGSVVSGWQPRLAVLLCAAVVGVRWFGPPGAQVLLPGMLFVAFAVGMTTVVGRLRIGLSGDRAGVVVRHPYSTRRVAWREVHRQEPREPAAPQRDQVLVLLDGNRVALPTGVPAGLVDAWRLALSPGHPGQ